MTPDAQAIFTDPMSVFAFLATLVAVIFWLSGVKRFEKFFEFLPPVIFVYFVPMICTTLGITPSSSATYDFTTRFFLPLALFLLMISIDLKSVAKLGPVALFMVTAGTVGIVLGGRQPGRAGKDPTEGGRYIPFDASFNISYSYTNATRSRRTNASVNLHTNLTRGWEFRYQASFDLVAGSPVRQQYSLHRDLHCWRLEFTRTISNVDSSFGFRIYLMSIPDLKFTRGREDYMGSLGGALGGGLGGF